MKFIAKTSRYPKYSPPRNFRLVKVECYMYFLPSSILLSSMQESGSDVMCMMASLNYYSRILDTPFYFIFCIFPLFYLSLQCSNQFFAFSKDKLLKTRKLRIVLCEVKWKLNILRTSDKQNIPLPSISKR